MNSRQRREFARHMERKVNGKIPPNWRIKFVRNAVSNSYLGAYCFFLKGEVAFYITTSRVKTPEDAINEITKFVMRKIDV